MRAPADELDRMHEAVRRIRSHRLFFIGGSPKSGTTWLQLLLDQHPSINCKGEGNLTNCLLPLTLRLAEDYNAHLAWKHDAVFAELQDYAGLADAHAAYLWTAGVALLLAQQAAAKPARMIGEKTPDNIRFLPQLASAFPKASFIHIVRDGRDAAVSNWFHNIRIDEAAARATFGSEEDFYRQFADRWAGDLEAGAAFAAAQPERLRTIRYEDLKADPAGKMRELFRFLGVASGRRIAEACGAAASFERLSGRKPGEENRDSFFRKGTSGDWRNHMSPAAAHAFEQRAGRWLAAFGYL
jgi:hypothetical protein